MNNREFVRKIIDSAERYPDETFHSGESRVYTCVNPYSYHMVRKNRHLFDAMDGLFVDGITMCWTIRALWGKKVPRLSFDMSGMALDLFNYLNEKDVDRSIYFLGTQQDVLEVSMKNIHEKFPGMKIKGYRNGYFQNKEEREQAIKDIVESGSDFTVVGMGSPLQEEFALDLKNAGYKGTVFTCGGFLHQTSRNITYYPDWINKYNLRAFYRLIHEKGMWKRLYNVLVEFPFLFVCDTLQTKLYKSSAEAKTV